jgi:hypothetical protein
LKSEFPGARDVLCRACAYRVTEAEKRAAIVLAEETARLQPEGFSADEISDHPHVAKAIRRVKHLKAVQKRIETETIEATWTAFSSQLLRD